MNCRTLLAALLTVFGMTGATGCLHAELIAQSPVFVGGAEGPTGTMHYRIPAMAVAPDGSILAFAEGRRTSADPGEEGYPIDLVMKRSTDRGKSWGPLTILAADPAYDFDDPMALVDENSGTVHLIYGQVPDGCGLFCVPPGTGSDSMNVWATSSTDNGQTWTDPVNITAQVKDPAWRGIVPGPGSGIQLKWQPEASRNGRLVVPASVDAKHNLVFFSDDAGGSWSRGNLAQVDLALGSAFDGNENEVVELTNGDLLMNARQNSGNSRRMFRSNDGGATWTEHRSGLTPIARVDGSMIRYSAVREGADRDRILFSGPTGAPIGSGANRNNMTVWTSYDEGLSFINPVIIKDGFGAYSVLQKLDDGTVGLLFEATGSTLIEFQSFDVAELEKSNHPSSLSHYDGFGNAIDPLNGGVGWSGSWTNSRATIATGALEFPGFHTVGDDQHVRLRGASISRNLGPAALDLGQNRSYYVSLFARHVDSDGLDSGSEFLDVLFQDANGVTRAAFGVGSNENFFINELGSTVTSAPNTLHKDVSYFMLAKITASDDSLSSNFDQLHLAWFDDPATIPDQESAIEWQLVGDTGINMSTSLQQLRIASGANGDWQVDGLRIGTDFGAVVVNTGVAPPDVLGDLNGDFKIDEDDWRVLRENMSMLTVALGHTEKLRMGDLDGSGRVGPEDFVAFVKLFEVSVGLGNLAHLYRTVPEPSSATISSIALLLWTLAQRQ